ncbi:hypothetical protein BJF83_09545 [Nocardiopsis sp. CNR-923]|nr:hypothetical protein BJF83_09545 [Nocardiopsis sp. CNR-923]
MRSEAWCTGLSRRQTRRWRSWTGAPARGRMTTPSEESKSDWHGATARRSTMRSWISERS